MECNGIESIYSNYDDHQPPGMESSSWHAFPPFYEDSCRMLEYAWNGVVMHVPIVSTPATHTNHEEWNMQCPLNVSLTTEAT